MKKHLALLTLLAALAHAGGLRAQDGFDPFPGGTAARYRFDLARNFFPTPADEEAGRAALLARAARLQADHPAPGQSALALERLLLAADSISRLTGKHLAYLTLRFNLDTRDAAAQAAAAALGDSVNRAFAFFGPALAAIPDSTLDRFIASRPGLRTFAFVIRQSRQGAAAGGEGGEAAAAVADELTRWQPALFWSLYGEIDFGTVPAPEGPLDVRRNWNQIASHPDRAVRQAGYLQNRRALSRHRGTYFQILRENVASRDALARLRGFGGGFPEESYGNRFLGVDDVRALLEAIAARSEVNKAYERARVEHLRRVAGLDTVHVWDLPLPEPGMAPPRFTVPEASRLVQEAMAPLGPGYARELARLLDPANGRLDMAPAPNRAQRPGFSTGLVGYPSMFFQGRYEGYLPDLVIFAHELGHGVQNGLMDAGGVAALNAGGASYFTESFAGFTELLLADHLYRTAPDRAARIYYLQAFLDRAAGLFDNARVSQYEQALYDSIPAGGVRSADAAEALMQRIGSRYSIWFGENSERIDQWLQPIHLFTWPLYRLNYTYSTLLALKYFELYSADPAGFVERYLALLSNGYDDEPGALLRRFLGFDLSGDALVADAVRVIESRLAELERLYAAAEEAG